MLLDCILRFISDVWNSTSREGEASRDWIPDRASPSPLSADQKQFPLLGAARFRAGEKVLAVSFGELQKEGLVPDITTEPLQ